MRGNSNTYVANVNLLTPSIVASKVRFVPYSQHPRTVCMRVEVFGCRYEDAIVAYQSPPGNPEFGPTLICIFFVLTCFSSVLVIFLAIF